MFTPAKFVDNGSNSQRPDHASRAENGHSKTPHHGNGFFAESILVPVRGHIMEKRAQFLSHKEIKAEELDEFALLDLTFFQRHSSLRKPRSNFKFSDTST